jgi:hypothetical protein
LELVIIEGRAGVNMSNKNQSGVFGAIITLVVFGMIVKCMVCDDTPNQTTREEPRREHDSVAAWVMCQEFVKRNLKSPASADFGGILSGDFQDPTTHAIHMGDGVYECNGFVDAQNSFGAQIRNEFGVTIQYMGSDNWKLLEGPVIQ